MELSLKQKEAWDILQDKIHTEVFYGGGAGGGKSFLGCFWLIANCIRYPGSRWLMGRAILKDVKESTLLTFFQVCKMMGWEINSDFRYNQIEATIKWVNGSDIYLKDLFLYPSDPEFDSLGSTEYTGAFIDESSQITEKAKNIVMSRIRYKLDEFGLIPKLLVASNPTKNFLYSQFYKPAKEGQLEKFRAFVPALVGDNPFISRYYTENLQKLDKISKERLLFGNFEYDDDPNRLFDYDAILDMFTNSADKGEKYVTVDVAGRGRDKTVIMIWDGFFVEEVIMKDNISNTEMDEILTKRKIPRSRCLIDEDGVGFGLVKDMPGVKGFVNNAQPIKKEDEREEDKVTHNYANLKSQCWFTLANYVNAGKIGIYRQIPIETKKLIIEDLEQIKQKDPGKDRPLRVLTKEEIKDLINRSTDCGDSMMMRMYFTFQKKNPLYATFLNAPTEAELKRKPIEKICFYCGLHYTEDKCPKCGKERLLTAKDLQAPKY